ncbi:MAG TPA: dihydroorotate dehydrogenase [Gemmatimonadales bacterium]|nr:dihydroorotate dehydrogenase [Gemmatimonadales bacterium]
MPRDLARSVFGQTFQNPVLLAAGTAGFGREVAGVIDVERLGGIITKAVSREPRPGNRSPRVAEFAGGMLNSVGLANPGLARVREEQIPWLAANLKRPRVLVNVVGFEEEHFAEVVGGLADAAGITAFEINLSCPNTHAGGMEFGADPATAAKVIELCRARTTLPLIAKLSPALPDIAGMAMAVRTAGADGVSVVNTMPGYLEREDGQPRLGNGNGGVSGPALLPVGVLAVRKIMQKSGGMPVIGVGGIRDADDARQYLHAGAALVAIGTAAMVRPRIPEEVVAELEAHGV